MEQRPLRLGHLVDDYCPRERRITNHVIVAIVDDAIRQTRCQTCEAEHPYKSAQAPRRRKKEGTTALYDEVLASVGGSQLVAPRTDGPSAPDETAEAAAPAADAPAVVEPDNQPVAAVAADGNGHSPDDRTDDSWPANRPLIRATLPRTENDQPVPRPIPEFTMHQRHSRGGQGFRHGWHGQGGNGNGNGGGRGGGGGFRSGRPGNGNGNGQGQGPGQGFGRGHGRPGPGQGDGNRGRHNGKRRPR